ncbi:MAG: hypothetical protein PVJ60_00615 [Phycisphaerales bacterium]|jgi:hypothetical protein
MALPVLNVADAKIGLLKSGSPAVPFQGTWGTAEVDGDDALELSGIVEEIDPDYTKNAGDAALTGTRNDDKVNHHTTTYYSAPAFEYKSREHIGVLKDEIHVFAAMHLQNVDSEGVSTPHLKTMTPHDTGPDHTVNAGYIGSFVFRKPTVASSYKIADVICAEKLGFSIDPGGYLQMSATCRGRGAIARSSNPSGTWARAAQLEAATASDLFHFGRINMTVDYAGSDNAVTVVGNTSWETTRAMVKVGHDGTGKFQNWGYGKFGGIFSTILNYDAHTLAIQAEIDDNDDALIEFIIGWDGGGVAATMPDGTEDGDLKWVLNVHVNEAKDIAGENGIAACQISGMIVGDKVNSIEPYTLTIADAQDAGY